MKVSKMKSECQVHLFVLWHKQYSSSSWRHSSLLHQGLLPPTVKMPLLHCRPTTWIDHSSAQSPQPKWKLRNSSAFCLAHLVQPSIKWTVLCKELNSFIQAVGLSVESHVPSVRLYFLTWYSRSVRTDSGHVITAYNIGVLYWVLIYLMYYHISCFFFHFYSN